MSSVTHDYSGATVLVTGGTSGIGAASAAAYRQAGAEVIITGTRAAPDDYDVDLSAYRYLQMDIEDGDSIDAMATSIPKLDILINNAGMALPSLGLDEYEPEIFARAVNMLLVGAFRVSRRLVDRLIASDIEGGASIISIGSMSSYFGISMVPGYGAAKTGLVGLTRTLAAKWGAEGLRVNCVAAGLTKSRMTSGTFEQEEWTAPTLQRTPLGRLGLPDDIAGAILFLTSKDASWITGQTLAVDGGFTVAG